MIAVLTELRAKNVNNVPINLMLADLFLHDKKTTDAIDILTALIKNNAKVPQVYIDLAKCRLAQGDKNAAIAAYQEGLKQNPEDIRLSLLLAAVHQGQGENDQAVAIYEALLAKNPNLDVVVNNLAVLLTEQYSGADKLQKAVQLSERFKDSDQPYYKDTYAWALIKQGKVNEGITVLQDLITRSPDTPVFRYHLGVAYASSENFGSAMAELQQAVELAGKNGDFLEEQAAKDLLAKIISKRGH
jgi:predicted Zn-dependent protease